MIRLLLLALLLCLPLSAWAAGSSTDQNLRFLAVTGDTLVKTGAGFLHTITCQSDTAATAGTIIVYNNTAESGTIIWSWTTSAVEYQPRTLFFDVSFDTGLYVGYTTTNDINCTVSFR